MVLTDINKNNAENLVDGFLADSHELSDVNKEYFKYVLMFLIDWESSNEDEMINNIKKHMESLNAKRTFLNYKSILKRFFEYYGVVVDFSLIGFKPKYIDFKSVQHQIEHLDDRRKNLSRREINKLVMTKLFAYLSWLGLDRLTMESLQRKDYNINEQTLTTINGSYDLKNPIYTDCAMYVINELQLNVQNNIFVFDSNGNKEYLQRYNASHLMYDRESVVYKEDDDLYIFRTKNIKEISSTTSKHIYNKNLIYKSGLFYKLMLFERLYETPINISNLSKIMARLNYTIVGDVNLLTEFYNYKRLF